MRAQPLTLPEAAEELGVHYMTVYRYVRTGRLPAKRVGGTWQIAPADLELVRRVGPGDRRPRPSGSAPSRSRLRRPSRRWRRGRRVGPPGGGARL